MIETITLTKTYRSAGRHGKALSDVSVTLPHGVTALIGSNGSGKSTLLRILSTIERADQGSFKVNGQLIDRRTLAQYRAQIGYVPQDVRFVSRMKCKDVLEYAGWVAGMDQKACRERIPEVLKIFGLEDLENARVGEVSGGQNRRIGIAAALMHNPSIIFCDEPTAGLDPQARIEVRNSLKAAAKNATVVLSSHLAEDVSTLAQHIVALDHGRVTFEGTWWELLANASDGAVSTGDELEMCLAYLAGRR